MKMVLLEAGGKSPNIVTSDARDLDEGARQAAWGIFFNQRQVCSAGSRLLVQKSIHDDVIERIIKIARTLISQQMETKMSVVSDDNKWACEFSSLPVSSANSPAKRDSD